MAHRELTCTPISIIDDATYCIDGPVCSGTVNLSTETIPGVCPSKGDVAIKHCSKSYPSFVDSGNCVAPVDAHCVISAAGRWQCVYPGIDNSKSETNSSNNAEPNNQSTTAIPALVHSQSSAHSSTSDGMALSAKTDNFSKKIKSPSTANSSNASAQAPNASLNVIVAASCCVLALVGLVLVKKRRSAGMRNSNSTLSQSARSSVMVL